MLFAPSSPCPLNVVFVLLSAHLVSCIPVYVSVGTFIPFEKNIEREVPAALHDKSNITVGDKVFAVRDGTRWWHTAVVVKVEEDCFAVKYRTMKA